MKYLSLILFLVCKSSVAAGIASVTISGKITTTYPTVFLRTFDYFLQDDIFYSEAVVNQKDSSFVLKLSINEPQEVMLLNASMFVTPGDSVSVITDGFKILEASGRNSGNYLLLSKISALRVVYPALEEKYSQNWTLFRTDLHQAYSRSEAIRDSLVKVIKPTEQLAAYAHDKLICTYLNFLLGTANNRISSRAVRANYLHDFDKEQIRRLQNIEPARGVIRKSSAWQGFVWNIVSFQTDQHSTGEQRLRDWMILGGKFLDNGQKGMFMVFVLERYYRDTKSGFDLAMIDSISTVADKELDNLFLFKSKLLAFKKKISQHNASIADNVLQTALAKPTKENVFFGDLLPNNGIVVIDFWASWCGPCIQDRQDGGATTALFAEKNVKMLSISIDESSENWLKALNRFGFNYSEYLLADYRNTPLAKTLNLVGVPRTIVVGPGKQVLAMDSPKLSDTFAWFQLLEKLQKQ